MQNLVRSIKHILIKLLTLIVLSLTAIIIFTLAYNPGGNKKSFNDMQLTLPFSLDKKDIIFKNESSSDAQAAPVMNTAQSFSSQVLKRAEAMINVKWTPSYNLVCEKASFTFIKGRIYYGIPYSMDFYQVTTPEDFLNKINNSKIIYGNDCSGFVSAAWGINRQTTYTLYNAMINKININGKIVQKIAWNDLKPGDALLLNKSSSEGHVMLYIGSDEKNNDNLTVYEQNVPTTVPYEPIPVARKDTRSKNNLIGQGYIPVRLVSSN